MKILIAGIGNRLLGDDGFGSYVAERLSKMMLPKNVDVVDYGCDLRALVSDLLNYQYVIFVDAIPRGLEAGTVYKVELTEKDVEIINPEDVAQLMKISSHELNVEIALALAKQLGCTLKKCLIIGVEPESFEIGMRLSDSVSKAVDIVIEEVLKEVERILNQTKK
ncbi:MAG: hypothetical protein DRJ31_02600 [Candidatus Methanomethylicota archaeon]|uniref:Hydrogenase maturation protease n=1 Tax=Thermoproteota archaeon TaxID=2056631 RepID=A0A497ESU9_9CREN|nr:MAG: hypothetical protein DRJ31_02600 [Candidatus Verstraetearchaeota archaeon]